MKAKYLISILFSCLILIIYGCGEVEIYTKSEIKGNVYLEDNLFQTAIMNAPKATVYVSKDSTITQTYLYKQVADDFGHYSFDYQSPNTTYLVGEYRDKNGLLYEGSVKINNSQKSDYNLKLNPIYPEGKLQITVKDDKGAILSGINTYLFVNKTQAVSVSETSPQNYLQTVQTSNGKGVVAFYNLKADTDYYIVAKNGTVISIIAKAIITADTLKSKIIKKINLSFSTPSPKLTVTVLDSLGDRLNKSDVYVFSSLLQAQSVSGVASTITDYVETQKTNANGEAVFLTLKDGIPYYLAAKSSFLIKSVVVSKSKINPTPISIPTNRDATATIKFP